MKRTLVTKFAILSLKSKLYLMNERCSDGVTEKWTIIKGLAKTFDSKNEAAEVVDALTGATSLRSKSDCIAIPIEIAEDRNVVDFEVKIYHSQSFWREEIVSASSAIEVLNETFAKLVKPDRVITSIEIFRRKNNKKEEKDLALGFEGRM